MKRGWLFSLGMILLLALVGWLVYFPTANVVRDSVNLGYMDVSASEAMALIEMTPDLMVIDVSPYYDKGHLPGAVSYYLGDGSLDAAIPNLDSDANYLVYCHVESVSRAGAQKLVDAGFSNVYRLDGDYRAWVNAGYPVEVIVS